MVTAPKIVLQNPYRILGVYTNAAKKDIVANKGKATAFLKVNKPVEYPLDLKGILPAPDRTLDLMNEAEGHLAIAKEQIKYAQFWFLKTTPIDDVAFNHLVAGNMAGAIEIWSKQESLSSLQNKLVCYLIESKLELAVKTAERLYEKFGNDYISKVDANCTIQMSGTELLHQFIDSLGEEIGMQTMLGFNLGADTKAYISSQTIGPLINKISSEVDKTKKVDHKDPKARIEAARKLVANTKEPFAQLKSILPATDSQYQMIADKLGLEILQCGIDYFIPLKDKEEDVPYTTMKMLKHARTIVVGGLAVGRCDDQIRELQKYIDNLPPKEIVREYNSLMEIIADFVNPQMKVKPEEAFLDHYLCQSVMSDDIDYISEPSLPDNSHETLSFIKRIRPLVVAMKEKVGRNEPHYVEICTLIGNVAISKSVESLNEAQEVLDKWGTEAAIAVKMPLTFRRELNVVSHYNSLLSSFKSMVSNIWEALLEIELMDVSGDFRTNRLNPNKSALKSIGNSAGLTLSKTAKDPTLFYTEEDCLNACDTYSSYAKYVERFPKGKYIKEAKEKMVAIEKREFESCSSVSAYEDFIKKYPKSGFVGKAKEKKEKEEIERKRVFIGIAIAAAVLLLIIIIANSN